MKNLDLLAVEARGTTYDPLTKRANKNRAIDSAIKSVKRAAASLVRRQQRAAGASPGDWLYDINGTAMTVDLILKNGLSDEIRKRAKMQLSSARASFDSAVQLDQYVTDKIIDGINPELF